MNKQQRIENWANFAHNLLLAKLNTTIITAKQMQEIAALSKVSRSIPSALQWAGLYDGSNITGVLESKIKGGDMRHAGLYMMTTLKNYNKAQKEKREEHRATPTSKPDGINDAIEMLADFQRICNEHYFSFNLEWYKAAREHFSKYKHTL